MRNLNKNKNSPGEVERGRGRKRAVAELRRRATPLSYFYSFLIHVQGVDEDEGGGVNMKKHRKTENAGVSEGDKNEEE